MVWMTMMPECQGGHHGKCPGTILAAPGEFGGVICECACHSKSSQLSRSFEQAPPSAQEIEREFWGTIKDGKDPDDFALYLEHFPDGAYAELARQKLAGLKKR